MKRTVWALAALAVAACSDGGGDGQGGGGGRRVVYVTEDVVAATTWDADAIYVVDQVIEVRAQLTVAPGAIVKFTPNGLLHTVTTGAIAAGGAGGERVIFTSIRDDVGGDTNEDGSATAPAPGDWPEIELLADGSSFHRCEIRYGGRTYGRVLHVSARATITGTVFRDNAGGDLGYGALEAASASAGTVITGNEFTRNALPLRVASAVCLDGSNTFSTGAAANGTQAVVVASGTVVTSACTWGEVEVPYLLEYELGISGAGTLTLAPGVVVKVGLGGWVDVATGGALALGEGAVFTSSRDDARGGDTNGDGASTAPQVGDWIGVWYEGDGAWELGAPFHYAGGPVET